ncbi:HSP20-like chaperone [Lipomyces kononenkoae]|uniref:HSP20-like chaperone n=1 Tax=Lipomyces kononenkoae TaxID=34357 RepID=A0ACC3SYU3_LIPKO
MAPIHPEVLWAQRSSETEADKNLIYLTVNVVDVMSPDVKLTPSSISYKGTSANGSEYAVELEFFEDIDVENSKTIVTGRHTFFILRKKEAKEEYWPRLVKDKRKVPYIRTDFSMWVDEDEQETAPAGDDFGGYGGGMDFSSLQNQLGSAMGGLGGDAPAGPSSFGLNEDDSDDDEEEDELPELVDDAKEEGESKE